MEETVYENKDICAKCGGMCCKKCGCDYSIEDFESLKIDYLQKVLEQGDVSIVSLQNFKYIKGHLIHEPFLYLRARNKNRPVIDLLSLKTTCASLLENGCKFTLANRPKGGVNLIPMAGDKKCYPKENPLSIVEGWKDYQKTLANLVKRLTGKSVNKKLEEDIYQLMCDVIEKKFDGVSPIEIHDINGLMPILQEAYPQIFEKAINDLSKKQNPLLVKKMVPNYKR